LLIDRMAVLDRGNFTEEQLGGSPCNITWRLPHDREGCTKNFREFKVIEA